MLSLRRNKLLFILLFFSEIVFSQQFPSRNYSTLDGLPNNSVNSVFKDSRGILWVGTANGLSSIQNGTLKNFYTSDGLAHNSCWAIVEDSNHNLWFGSHGGGLTFYDGKKFTIINVKNGLINDRVRKLFFYKNHLYVGTEFGLTVIDINSKKIILNKKITGIRNLFQVMGFFEFHSKIYFETFNDGMWSIDLKLKNINLIKKQEGGIFSIYKDDDSLYVSNTFSNINFINKISIRDYVDNKKSNISFGNSVFWDFAKDKRGNIYVAGNGVNFSTGGLFKIKKNKIINVNTSFGIESKEVWSLHYDPKMDVLYVGTINKGLFEIDLKQQIKYYPSSFYNKPKLDVVAITNIEKGNLLLHKDGLLFLKRNEIHNEISNQKFYDFAQHSFRTNPKLNEYEYFDSFVKSRLESFELRSLKVINSIIWVNSTIGLFGVNNDGIIMEYYPYSASAFDFTDSKKIVFQIAYGKFCTVNDFRNNTAFKKYEPKNLNNPKDAFAIFSLRDKYYIFSSSNGLYTSHNNKFYSYYFNNVWKENELVQATINYKKELVIANALGDVFIIDDSKGFKLIKKIDRKELIGNSISFLKCYKDYLLIGTEKGLNIYKDGIVRLIDEEQGLKSKILTSANLIGTFLTIGTQNGYYEFDLQKYLSTKNSPQKIKITAIEVNFESINKSNFKWLNYNFNEIELPYNKNTISIGFEPQNCQYPNKLEYRYKVIGLRNSNWSKWTKDKNINLTYLPNGNYKIRLVTKDLHSGIVSSSEILSIRITPPFWETWWFMLGNFLLFSITGFVIYKKRIQFIKKQEQAKAVTQKRLAETKMEALQSQMNPHFIFNAMNSIQNYIIDNNVDDALMYMGEFSKLIRQTLNNSSKLRINLSDEIQYLQSYIALENMRLKNKVIVELYIDDDLDLFETEIPPMLIQPFIENVFVHAFDSYSKKPTLKLSFKQIEDFLFCEIKDNGKGMATDNLNKLNTSKGIILVKERIALFQFDIVEAVTISSSLNGGTTVVLKLQIDSF
ncbi:sensor histidine kinase [Flavobacterium petrolei]|uniref:sensor histidine kinase n=1 Tax=Flavobacterium petrolei TaxID=2259594 RepID=UPI003756EF6E